MRIDLLNDPRLKPYWDAQAQFGPFTKGPMEFLRYQEEGMKKGIYVASKTAHAPIWLDLRKSGLPIISTWIDEAGPGQTEDRGELAVRCLAEVSAASAVIVYCKPGEILKGALMEIGAALAQGIPIYCVGESDMLSNSVFPHHPLWHQCAAMGDAIEGAVGRQTL